MYAMISTYSVCNDIYRKLIQRKLSIFLFLAFIGWERFDFHGKLPYIRFAIYFQSPLVFFLCYLHYLFEIRCGGLLLFEEYSLR